MKNYFSVYLVDGILFMDDIEANVWADYNIVDLGNGYSGIHYVYTYHIDTDKDTGIAVCYDENKQYEVRFTRLDDRAFFDGSESVIDVDDYGVGAWKI